MANPILYTNRANEQLGTRIAEYSPALIKSFSEHAKYKLASNAIKSKDYDGLKHVLNFYESSALIGTAIHRLDVEAAKIIINQQNFATQLSNDHIIRELMHEEDARFDYKEQEKRKTEILKLLMNAKTTFGNYELEIFSERISKEEFDKFCQDKKIDLTKPEYQGLDLSHYKISDMKPVYELGDNKNPSIVDVVLSRTFSQEISEKKLRKIYEKILKSDSIAKDYLCYLALQIIKGNTIKILFEKNVASYYSHSDNIIKIDINFLKEKVFNIDSVVVHEWGHFFYDDIFKFEAMPFDRAYIKNITLPQIEARDDAFVDEDDLYLAHPEKLQGLVSFVNKYEAVARKPIYKAAELLKFDTTELDKYKLTSEYTEFFKQKSIIDVFYVNAHRAFRSEDKGIKMDELPIDVIKSLQDIYIAYSGEKDTCANPALLEETELGLFEEPGKQGAKIKEKLEKWVMEVFLPQVIQELGLTPKQIHFLERIADYVNRGGNMFSEQGGSSSNEKAVELIVRYAELKVAGLDQDILSSFDGLVAFHNEYASPIVQREIAEHHAKCAAALHSDNITCIADLN